jgi:L-threonylcarbamoyladenylate synthase
MTEVVSIAEDGPDAARIALEECIWDGGVAVFPADTLYGLACDPLSESAVTRIHRLKGREEGKSSAVMYFSPGAARELIAGLGERTGAAVGALLPGPVTLVLPNPERRYPLACREDPERLGIRLIEGPLAGMPLPVFQTSANPSGYGAPSSFGAIDEGILAGADLGIDGADLGGEPSTVVDLSALDSTGEWWVLREGALPTDEIARRLAAADVGA